MTIESATASPPPTIFHYKKKERKRGKLVHILCRSDLMTAAVQVIGRGGETNLHSHPTLDGFWFVLSGRARFYTTDDDVVAELGPDEGILIPRGFPYWFETASQEELEILQVEASTRLAATLAEFVDGRIDYTRPRQSMQEEEDEVFGSFEK